jgi:hypothetical protein
MAWVGAACQQGRRLVPRLGQELGLRVSPRTLKRALRRAGYGWKRTRRSLKRQRDPAAFAACRQQLAGLHRAEQAGRLAVYYLDEVRFSRQAPVPYAWQVRGQPCVGRPAERGAGGGYSVLGFWRPADPQATGCQAFTAIVSATAFTAELFVLAVAEFVTHLTQPTVLVLDNASIHKAHLVKAQMAAWAAAGLRLLFLPPYSPELNRIEILWRFCKHYWLTPAAYQTPQTLLQHVSDLLLAMGTPQYQITFG